MSNRAIRAQRSLVKREADGMADAVTVLRRKIAEDPGAGAGSGTTPLISASALHETITRIEGHLVQLKTLTQHRSK